MALFLYMSKQEWAFPKVWPQIWKNIAVENIIYCML